MKDARDTVGLSPDLDKLRGHVETLGVSLTLWGRRDDTKAQPAVRGAANTAMDAVDELLRELHTLRNRLVSEIRQSDDATAARVDALLGRAGGAR